MGFNDSGERPLHRYYIVLSQDNDISNLEVPCGVMPLVIFSETADVLRVPSLPEVTD